MRYQFIILIVYFKRCFFFFFFFFFTVNIFWYAKICFDSIKNGERSECSKLEQRSVIKFLLAEKCKPYEFTEECVMFGETCFSKNIFTNRLNMYLSPQVWVKDIDSLVKKKFRIYWSLKKVILTVFWNMKRVIAIDFLEKRCNCKRRFLLPLIRQNSSYLLNNLRII